MRVRKSTVALWLLWLGGCAIAIVAPQLLPERFYFDAQTVRELLTDRWAEHSESFVSTAAAYRLLGFPALWPLGFAGPLSFTLSFLAIAYAASLGTLRWRPGIVLLLAAWTVPLAVFHGTLSKEMFAIAAVAAMLRLSTSPKGMLAAAVVALAYAALFRNYWAVIVTLWLVFLVAWGTTRSWLAMLAGGIGAFLAMSFAAEALVGLHLSDGRTIVVETRAYDLDSATTIHNPLPNTSVWADLANALWGWFTLTFPFHLFGLGAPQHIAFALFQFVNTCWFIAAVRHLPRRAGGRAFDADDWRSAAAASWCVAYTFVQGMFEPDFGSFVKHEANLLPMIVWLLARTPATHPTRRVSGEIADRTA